MTFTTITKLAACCSLSSIVIGAQARAQDATVPVAADEPAGIADIVVTARRTNENLQRTPVAVTAIGAVALQQQQIGDAVDLQRTAPSLVIATGAPASSSFTFVSMRGQGNLQPTVSNDPAVATYVDGVYIPRPSQGVTDLGDLERVEVLRGPQGTLFGRNTTGGALNILTAQPTDEFKLIVRGELGNYRQRAAGIIVNGPLADGLTARVTYNYKDRDGYAPNTDGPEDLNGEHSHFVRAKLRYEGSGWDVNLSGDYNRISNDGQFTALAGYNAATYNAFGPSVIGALNNSLHTRANWYVGHNNAYVVPSTNPLYASLSPEAKALFQRRPYNTLDAYGFAATINGDLGAVNVKSISAFRYSDSWGLNDTDGSSVAILTTLSQFKSKQYSQEIQFSGEWGDRFKWIAGGYYSRETGIESSRSQVFGLRGSLIGQNLADVKNITTGLFGQGYYQLTDRVRFTGGLRWTWDKRQTVLHNLTVYGLPANALVPSGAVLAVNCNVAAPDSTPTAIDCNQTQNVSFNYPAWTGGFDFQANDTLFLYAKTSGAAKSGGWNTRAGSLPAFKPEKTKDVEIGAKAKWLDNRLRTNLALFHAWQTGVQRNAAALTNLGTVSQYIVNAGDARVWGAEFEVVAAPWTGMEINSSLSLMDGKYKAGSFTEVQTVSGARVIVDRSGEPLPQLPRRQFNIGATQRFPVPIGELSLHLDYAYVSAQDFNPGTAAAGAAPAVRAAIAEQNRFSHMPGYGLVNGRVSVQLDDPAIEIYAFARNLAGKKYIVRPFADLYAAGLGFASEFVGEPRMYGAGMTIRFGKN